MAGRIGFAAEHRVVLYSAYKTAAIDAGLPRIASLKDGSAGSSRKISEEILLSVFIAFSSRGNSVLINNGTAGLPIVTVSK